MYAYDQVGLTVMQVQAGDALDYDNGTINIYEVQTPEPSTMILTLSCGAILVGRRLARRTRLAIQTTH